MTSRHSTTQPNNSSTASTDDELDNDFPEVELEPEQVLDIGSNPIEVVRDEPDSEDESSEEAAVEEEESAEETPQSGSISKEQFDALLQEHYGITADVFKAGISFVAESQEAIVNYTYAKAWNVDMMEAANRIDQVLEYIDTLPEAEQKRYQEEGTAEDTMKLWETIAATKKAKRQYVKPSGGAPPAAKPARSFTSAEIDAMSDADYLRLQPQIMQAYKEGRVR